MNCPVVVKKKLILYTAICLTLLSKVNYKFNFNILKTRPILYKVIKSLVATER